MKKILLLLLLGTQLNVYSQSFAEQYNWMLGTWEMKIGSKSIFEEWISKDDSTFGGSSYSLDSKGNKKIMETIELRSRNGIAVYVPTVGNQNKNQPVIFTISILEKNKLRAENLAHDFPQAIVYELKNPSELYARIEGVSKGKIKKEEWVFKKN
jgi:hypothetical protein